MLKINLLKMEGYGKRCPGDLDTRCLCASCFETWDCWGWTAWIRQAEAAIANAEVKP